MRAQAAVGTKPSLFLNAAIAIGDYLIGAAKADGPHLAWKTTNKMTDTVSYNRTDLYSGSSGIGLFFLELYKHTGQQKHLRIARKALQAAIAKEKTNPLQPAFVTGRMGIAYALLALYKTTGSQTYLKQALTLAKTCRLAARPVHEYLNGNAGTLLCVLHLHAASQEPWLLEMANDYAGHVLQGIQPAANGVCWDRNPFQVQPLCGFSHGTSGIGFVFLELGHYLKNAAYYQIAEQAFAYENACFNKATGNWPDFRLNMWTAEQWADFEAAYSRGDMAPFNAVQNMVAWCHGAPGIGLSRIVAYQRTRKPAYLHDLSQALTVTRKTRLRSLSLCHGQAGNLEINIESYAALGRKRQWAFAQTGGQQLVDEWKEQADQHDPGLFTGIAGAGYSLLRLHNPQLTVSILAPRLTATSPATPGRELRFLRLDTPAVQALLPSSHADASPVEQLKREMIEHYPSSGLLFIKGRLHRRNAGRLSRLSDAALLNCNLQLDEDCMLSLTSKDKGILLNYSVQGIDEKHISLFCYEVLMAFQNPRKVRQAVDTVGDRFGITKPGQRELLQSKVMEQIRYAVHAGLLISRDT